MVWMPSVPASAWIARTTRHAFGLRLADQAGDEAAVDLQALDREAVQVRQRREAGAEVVQLRQHAVAAQRAQRAQRARRVVEQRAPR